MDGNGRWAAARGQPRSVGHRWGARAVRGVVEAAPNLGIGTLTLYAFSADNWQRLAQEVTTLMRLLRGYLRAEIETSVRHGVRMSVIGQRDRLSQRLRAAIDEAEAATIAGRRLHLRIAINYSARESIVHAASRLRPGTVPRREAFARLLGDADHSGEPALNVDLLIRTSGEHCLSDFLLWECAYAELLFMAKMWPDFTAADLEAAVTEFRRRERRFGGVPAGVSA
jgi:undecaprenyl diphosphate synthase